MLYNKSWLSLFSRNICYSSTKFIAQSKRQHVFKREIIKFNFNDIIPNPTIKQHNICKYCNGSGYIPCNMCDLCKNKHCSTCNDKWYIPCQICGGSGVSHVSYN